MYQFATITGKRQLTIPADLYRSMGFSGGQKVIVSFEDNALRVESATDLVERLAGSLPVPMNVKTDNLDAVIRQAKRTYVQKRMKRQSV